VSPRRHILFRQLFFPMLLLLLLGLAGVYNVAVGTDPDLAQELMKFPKADAVFQARHVYGLHHWLYQTIAFLGLIQLGLVVVTGLSQARHSFVIRLHLFVASAQVILHTIRWMQCVRIASILQSLGLIKDEPERNDLWIYFTCLILVVLALTIAWGLLLGMRQVRNLYWHEHYLEPLWGDRVVENLRTHGDDPDFRKSWYLSWAAHILVLIVIPWLLTLRGCVRPYDIPDGDGSPAMQLQVVKVQQKKKKKQRVVLNMNSPIIFHVPEISEDVLNEVDKITENTYEASSKGNFGKGKGTKPGFAGGKGNEVRFIRLKYAGGDWDQNMGAGADYNFLIRFGELTKLGIARETEAIAITQLRAFPSGRAPPFVYITGKAGINPTAAEIKALRRYLLEEGGMIFADNGGGYFDNAFRNLMRQVVPELPMVVISHDDIIYRQPFVFPDGAPPLWHHSGNEAMGLKHNGRWICFYHQGDMNDAWQTGSSGVSKATAEQSFKMGINVVYYAFVQYLQFHGK
jgi:hypothetical protein